MNRWQVQPGDWQHLTNRQQKRLFKTGTRLAGTLMIGLIVSGLLIEALCGL